MNETTTEIGLKSLIADTNEKMLAINSKYEMISTDMKEANWTNALKKLERLFSDPDYIIIKDIFADNVKSNYDVTPTIDEFQRVAGNYLRNEFSENLPDIIEHLTTNFNSLFSQTIFSVANMEEVTREKNIFNISIQLFNTQSYKKNPLFTMSIFPQDNQAILEMDKDYYGEASSLISTYKEAIQEILRNIAELNDVQAFYEMEYFLDKEYLLDIIEDKRIGTTHFGDSQKKVLQKLKEQLLEQHKFLSSKIQAYQDDNKSLKLIKRSHLETHDEDGAKKSTFINFKGRKEQKELESETLKLIGKLVEDRLHLITHISDVQEKFADNLIEDSVNAAYEIGLLGFLETSTFFSSDNGNKRSRTFYKKGAELMKKVTTSTYSEVEISE